MCFPGPALVNLPKSCNISAPTPADCPDRADIQRDVDDYMLISAAVAVALFLLFCLYFPAKPPLPPAPSSAIQRTEFWTGARQIFRNRSALLICFAYSMGVTLISLYHSKLLFLCKGRDGLMAQCDGEQLRASECHRQTDWSDWTVCRVWTVCPCNCYRVVDRQVRHILILI